MEKSQIIVTILSNLIEWALTRDAFDLGLHLNSITSQNKENLFLRWHAFKSYLLTNAVIISTSPKPNIQNYETIHGVIDCL